jgi:hypothetical protein
LQKNHWNDEDNQRQLLDFIGRDLGVQCAEDWYKLKETKVLERGADVVLQQYEYSLFMALSKLYPTVLWDGWRFHHTPRRFWEDVKNHKRFFQSIGKQLGIKNYGDWYQLKITDGKQKETLEGILQRFYCGSLIKALVTVFKGKICLIPLLPIVIRWFQSFTGKRTSLMELEKITGIL